MAAGLTRLSFIAVRAGGLACLAALAAPSPSMAQPDAKTLADAKAKSGAPTLTKDEIAGLSGLQLPVKTPDSTAVSGVTVGARRTPTVSELTVTLPLCPAVKDHPDPEFEPPKLLSSYPVRGTTVKGGLIILRLTFDRPMTCTGLLDKLDGTPNPCPAPLIAPMFSRDRRTFLTVCVLHVPRGPGGRAAATPSLGEADPAFGLRLENFTSLGGQPLKPSELNFYVDPESQPVQTMREAMAQDKFMRDAQKATGEPR